jgi:phosphoglycerol transferase
VWWGYEDEKLFAYAKEELSRLSQTSQPFNLTFLTADTHFPDGYVCKLCKNEHESQYANAISCSSRQVANFISWVQQQNFYSNTTIVIVGDHLSMDTKFFANLDPAYQRTTINIIINSPVNSKFTKNRNFCTFDMFPTTLASLGATIKGDRLGLGTNLFSGVPTLAETVGIESLNKELDKHSNFYNNTFIY